MALTKLKISNLETGSITGDKVSGGIGANSRYFMANTFYLSDSSWNSIANTTVRKDKSIYFVIGGKNFDSNTKIYVNDTLTTNTIIGTSEIRCSISNTSQQISDLDFSKKYDVEVTNSQGYSLIFKNKIETENIPITAYGYVIGGDGPTTSSAYTKIDFSNDSVTTSPQTTLSNRYYVNGGSTGNANYAWYFSNATVISRIEYATGSDIFESTNLGTHGHHGATGTFDYAITFSNPIGSIYKYTYANQTSSSILFFYNAPYLSGTVSGNFDQAYRCGGGPNPGISYCERIDYSSMTTRYLPILRLTKPCFWVGSTSNLNYDWITLGYANGASSTEVNRIDFSNDNIVAVLRGYTTTTAGYGYAEGQIATDTYIYHNGGFGALSGIARQEIANDTVNASSRGNLVTGRYYHTGTGGFPG